ncbi:MAG: serine hydrolase domain-containing protein [Bacteroidota bacterium]|nr:serine hydrolase domain-containing protein [Bacteroidota bacterium]
MSFRKFISIVSFFSLIFSACHSGVNRSKPVISDSTTHLGQASYKIPPEDFKRYYNGIKNFYEKTLIKSGFNGGILVAKRGQVIFEDYHGFFDLKKKDSLTKHSAFHLASISKTFTAMATLKLAELGKLSVNDDVKKYFPAFPYDNVTIRLLLSHRSGLPNYIYFMEKLGWNKKQYCTNEDVLDYLLKYHPPATSNPDTHFSYCNTNYALLGLIIEKASGQPYADFLQQYFFTPLHMKDTYVFNVADSATAMPSYDWRGRREGLTFLDIGFGDKNIYSTPEDLLKWDQALYGNRLFNKQTLQAAFTPYSNEKPGIRNYGYGWRMNVYPNGKKVIYHNGWWHGNNTVFIRMIQDSVTIIVLGNKYNRSIYQSKKMTEIFNQDSMMEDDENGIASKEETYPLQKSHSAHTKKSKASSKKIRVKKHRKKR